MQNMSLPFLQLSLLKRSFKCYAQGKGAFGFSEINIYHSVQNYFILQAFQPPKKIETETLCITA